MGNQRVVTATEVRRNLSAILRRLSRRHERTIIKSSGTPEADLLPGPDYEQLLAQSRRQSAFHDLARHLGREVEQRGLSEDEFMNDLEQTKRHIFTEQYGRAA